MYFRRLTLDLGPRTLDFRRQLPRFKIIPHPLVVPAIVGAADVRAPGMHLAAQRLRVAVPAIAVGALADEVRPAVIPARHALVQILRAEIEGKGATARAADRQ